MRFGHYLKDRVVPLLMLLFSACFAALALTIYSVDVVIVTMICTVMITAGLAGFLWDYLSRRRFYGSLEEAVKNKGDAYYVTEFIDRPSFREGSLTYDCLERATKDMNDRIAQYRIASEEYQEYVETWIHEIKTPIAAARLTIGNRKDPGLQTLEHELDRTEAYVEQALYYARSTAVEKDYAIKAVNLESLVKGAVKKQSRTLIEQGITPRFEGLDSNVYSDPKWLDFILGQIIANAAKYARPKSDGHVPEIRFSAKRIDAGFDSDKTILSIADNGIGIPAHDVGRVFEKGFTGENGRLHAKSTGIGLYLCSRLCARMKLKILLESNEKESTTVTIEFPLSKMYFLENR